MKREWAEIREWRKQKKEKEEQKKETPVDFKGSPAPVEEKKEDKKEDHKNNDGAMILIGISVIARSLASSSVNSIDARSNFLDIILETG